MKNACSGVWANGRSLGWRHKGKLGHGGPVCVCLRKLQYMDPESMAPLKEMKQFLRKNNQSATFSFKATRPEGFSDSDPLGGIWSLWEHPL